MLAFKLDIIKRSSSRTADVVDLQVGVVEGDSELISLAIIAPVVVEFKRCDVMGFVRCNALDKTE
eukprot:4221228-Ditylum_brightwellii.AAC.1